MTSDDDNTMERLRDLGRATQNLAPRDNFSDRVMAAVEAEALVQETNRHVIPMNRGKRPEARGLLVDLMKPARGMLMLSALAAAAAGIFALQSETEFESALMSSVDVLEVDTHE